MAQKTPNPWGKRMTITRESIKKNQQSLHQSEAGKELKALRELLLSSDRDRVEEAYRRLDALEKRLSPDARTRETSEILANAMRLRLSGDDQLVDILKPVVVEQFHRTSREEPDVMADALFPILGPAIRKMIASMLIPDSENKKRSYKLDQLYLIDKESGLLLCHVSSSKASTQDAAMVSGMLNAIQSFVHEAFNANEFDGLDVLQVGGLSVWIEWGPSAVLAAVIRGSGPQRLRDEMQIYLENVHMNYAEELQDQQGDTTAFEPLSAELATFLEHHDGSLKNKVKNLHPRIKQWLVGLLVVAFGLIIWTLFNLYDKNRWDEFLAAIESEPGIIVTDSDRRFREYRVSGLKDNLSKNPMELLAISGINPEYVQMEFELYQAIHPKFTLARIHSLLTPPTGVELSLDGRRLHIIGNVSEQWISNARTLVKSVAGAHNVVVVRD